MNANWNKSPRPWPGSAWLLAATLGALRRAPELGGLVGLAALLNFWALGRNGWANTYYAAAVQAGTKSWKAMFFGSTDASNFITVDKTPLSLWPMEISARIFGLNSWSMLVPQALMGVASVALVYDLVRRRFGRVGGFVAGIILVNLLGTRERYSRRKDLYW